MDVDEAGPLRRHRSDGHHAAHRRVRHHARKIQNGADDAEKLEAHLRSRVIWLAYPVLIVYICILAILYVMIERHA